MIQTNLELDLGWCKAHAEISDMISGEVFLWVEGVRQPTKAELRTARRALAVFAAEHFLYANVDAANATNMRFARHFGFREVRRAGNVSVQTRGVN